MTKFVETTLGEVCADSGGLIQTGPFGSQLHQSDYSDKGIPVVMPADIKNGRIDESRVARVYEGHVERLKRHKLEVGDIVYGRRGDIGRQAIIRSENEGWLCGTGCLRLSLGRFPRIVPEYLHLYLSMPEVIGWIQNQAIGATMPNLNTQILKRVPLIFPEDVEAQKKMVAVFATYDDLIENNKRRITLLENMAEEIYREWFVRFRFPGWQEAEFEKGLPVNWQAVGLGQIAKFVMGQSPKSEFYNRNGDGLPFHQGVGTFGKRFPTNDIYCSVTGREAKAGDVLFSVRAPVGRLNIALERLVIGRGLAAVRHHRDCQSYLYYLLSTAFSNEDIIGNGAIFNAVGKDELLSFKVLSPSGELVDAFEKLVRPIDDQISGLIRQNEVLEKTKNELLPRLISGKLSVENLDIQFPPSMQTDSSNSADEAAA